MDVTSLYTNIPQEEGITIVCNAYEVFHKKNPPIPTALLKEMLGLILKENSFQISRLPRTSNRGLQFAVRGAAFKHNLI